MPVAVRLTSPDRPTAYTSFPAAPYNVSALRKPFSPEAQLGPMVSKERPSSSLSLDLPLPPRRARPLPETSLFSTGEASAQHTQQMARMPMAGSHETFFAGRGRADRDAEWSFRGPTLSSHHGTVAQWPLATRNASGFRGEGQVKGRSSFDEGLPLPDLTLDAAAIAEHIKSARNTHALLALLHTLGRKFEPQHVIGVAWRAMELLPADGEGRSLSKQAWRLACEVGDLTLT